MFMNNIILYTTESLGTNVEESVADSTGIIREMLDKTLNWFMDKSADLVIAAIFLLIGLKLVSIVHKILCKSFQKTKMDESVSGFLLSFIKIALSIVVFISTAAIIGIEITSFVTILGTAGIALSLGLQGSLTNLIGGVLILILKPFTVGDYIKEDNKGNEGTVISIDIFYTKLRTLENRIVVIPNGILASTSLLNITTEGKRRLDIDISVGYEMDISYVKKIIMEVIDAEDRILREEPIDVFIGEFGGNGIRMGIRAWAKVDDFWPTLCDLREEVKKAFDQNGIKIPHNQLDVNIKEK